MEPLVNIGVPVYNGAEYLEECLNSILNQDYENWECCIINNQSTDETPDIGKRFEKLDSRFRLITNDSFVEMIVNFNYTTKYISPKAVYFKVVCADDWLFPEYLSSIVPLMEENPQCGISLSFRLDNLKVGCVGLNYYDGPVFNGRKILLSELSGAINITGSETNQLYRIETLKKIESYPEIFSPESYNFDTSLAYDLLHISDLVFEFQVLSYTRRHEGTFTSKYKDRFRTSLNAREFELNRFRKDYPELEDHYKGIRHRYGMVYLKRKLRRDRDFIEWHQKWLHPDRKFSAWEFISVVVKSILGKLFFTRKGMRR